MWKINNTNQKITMTKGDTPSFKISLTVIAEDGSEVEYQPKPDDSIIFAMKKTANDTEPLVTIDIPTDTLMLKFKQSDTKDLALGKYIYEISLNNNVEEYHDTFIYEKEIELCTEVY